MERARSLRKEERVLLWRKGRERARRRESRMERARSLRKGGACPSLAEGARARRRAPHGASELSGETGSRKGEVCPSLKARERSGESGSLALYRLALWGNRLALWGIRLARSLQARSPGKQVKAGCFAWRLSGGEPPNPPRSRRVRTVDDTHLVEQLLPEGWGCSVVSK